MYMVGSWVWVTMAMQSGQGQFSNEAHACQDGFSSFDDCELECTEVVERNRKGFSMKHT